MVIYFFLKIMLIKKVIYKSKKNDAGDEIEGSGD